MGTCNMYKKAEPKRGRGTVGKRGGYSKTQKETINEKVEEQEKKVIEKNENREREKR